MPTKKKSKKAPPPSTVLVGTYRKEQLEKWVLPRGLYNYPIHTEDTAIEKAAPSVTELWLYAGKSGKRRFSAKFERKVTVSELTKLGYPRGKGKPHSDHYLLFRIAPLPDVENLPAEPPRIFIRLRDFVRSVKVLAELRKQFDDHFADGSKRKPTAHTATAKSQENISYFADLPEDLLEDWLGNLCVCEAAEQLSFDSFLNAPFVPDPSPTKNTTPGLLRTECQPDGSLRCIDLFSGAGGLSEGLSEAGFHSLFAAEIVPTYAKTYEFNHRGAQVTTADIRTLDAETIRKQLGIERGELDLIAGGPPCQGFSINAPVRSILDKRNHLFKEYLRFVDAFQPRCILIENVPGLVSFEDGKTLHAILDALAELGYGADVRILGAAYYGVPQMRWRTIIIGTRGKELPSEAFPDPICHAPIEPNFTSTFDGHSLLKIPSAEKSSKFTTVKDAIGDLPPLRNGEHGAPVKDYPMPPQCDYQRRARRGSTGIHNHEAPRLSAINVERMSFIPPGGNWTDIPDGLLPEGMKQARKSDHTKRYGRVSPDGLASTILTKCDPHWGAYIHYNQDRSFTVREAARIQSFPDHYIFLGSMAEQFAQVGNAVPPMLAQAIGISIKSILEREV